MAQKRKNHQSKLDRAEALLHALEEKTARAVKKNLGPVWRDNLFEIMMTRLELAKKDKATFAALPAEIMQTPSALPHFASLAAGTLSRMLKLAKAPHAPAHVAGFAVLYAHVIRTFIDDNSRDLAKTMAALDRDLAHFERFCGYVTCK